MARAAAGLAGMRVVELSPAIERGIANYPMPPLVIDKVREVERDVQYCQCLTIAERSSTHVDAPAHFHPHPMHMSIDTFPPDKRIALVVLDDVSRACRRWHRFVLKGGQMGTPSFFSQVKAGKVWSRTKSRRVRR